MALGRGRGYAFSSDELAHLVVAPTSGQLAERDLDRVVGGTIRYDKPEPGQDLHEPHHREADAEKDFGDRMAAGLSGAGNAVAGGVATANISGGAILSAAQAGPVIPFPSDSD